MQRVVWVLVALCSAQSQSQSQSQSQQSQSQQSQSQSDVPVLQCPPDAAAEGMCARVGSPSEDQVFTLGGSNGSLVVSLSEGKLGVWCARGAGLGARGGPAYSGGVRVAVVVLRGCALGEGGAARGLAAMRVGPPAQLQLLAVPPGPMPDDTLAGLDQLEDLQLQAPDGNDTAARLSAAAFTHVPRLTVLRADRVAVPVHALPSTLETLWLLPPEPIALDERWATRMTRLKLLGVHGVNTSAEWSAACPPALRRVALDRLVSAAAGLWDQCKQLETLRLRGGTADALPARWLASLPNLLAVTMEKLPLGGGIPEDLLHESPKLQKLELRACGLRSLPAGLLRDASLLEELDLSDNALTLLNDDWLGSASRLQTLKIAGNPLHSLPALPPALQSLDASDAPLGDTCGVGTAASPLQHVTSLRRVSLRHTGATRLCVDWRLALTLLDTLDLRDNNITELLPSDLRWARADGVRGTVQLDGNPPLSVLYTRHDYEDSIAQATEASDATAATDAAAAAAGSVRLSGAALRCDCRLYYWALLQSQRHATPTPRHALRADFDDARCREPADMASARLSPQTAARLRCAVACPRDVTCGCSARAAAADVTGVVCSAAQATPQVLAALESFPGPLELEIENASLTRAPRLQHALALRLARNRLAALPALPAQLQLLDARHNRLAAAGAERWPRALRLRLAGNPLRCDCGAREQLQLLHSRRDQVLDYTSLQCAEGGSLAALGGVCTALDELTGGLAGGVAAGVALLAGAAAGLLLARKYRHLIKRWLAARGVCCVSGGEPAADEAAADWDVFVSYAHADAAWVLRALLPRLERRWRVCVHVRDWRAGGWIPRQIERSVTGSRRTLAVLSPHYAASRWARAELALAQALPPGDPPRLLLVLASPPEELGDELRAAVARHTYVRKDDPWFWDKLADALPKKPLGPVKNDARPPPAAALALDEPPAGKPVSLQTVSIERNVPVTKPEPAPAK